MGPGPDPGDQLDCKVGGVDGDGSEDDSPGLSCDAFV